MTVPSLCSVYIDIDKMIFSTRRYEIKYSRRISIAGVPPAISKAAVFLALKAQWHREQSRLDEGVSRKNRGLLALTPVRSPIRPRDAC